MYKTMLYFVVDVTSEDDGLFMCELKDKENRNKTQALSITGVHCFQILNIDYYRI